MDDEIEHTHTCLDKTRPSFAPLTHYTNIFMHYFPLVVEGLTFFPFSLDLYPPTTSSLTKVTFFIIVIIYHCLFIFIILFSNQVWN